jgi:uncharacterized protein
MNASTSSKRSLLLFFVLVFALSVPFWVLNAIFPTNLPVDNLPVDNLPVTDIGATFVPLIAASILVYREEKLWGVRNLWERAFDYKKITQKIWYVPIIFLMPLLYVLTYGAMRLVGLPVPIEWHIPLLTPLIFIGFFFAAVGEELGYTDMPLIPCRSGTPH